MKEADLLNSAHASMGHGQVIGAVQIPVYRVRQCSLLIYLYVQHGDGSFAPGKRYGSASPDEYGASLLFTVVAEQSLKSESKLCSHRRSLP